MADTAGQQPDSAGQQVGTAGQQPDSAGQQVGTAGRQPDSAGKQLVLASSSPRRQELLARLGVAFTVDSPDVDEQVRPGEEAVEYAARVAADKCEAVVRGWEGAVVLSADTIVILDGEPIGKPVDSDEAVAMLKRLSGRIHEVATAICLAVPGSGLRHGLETAKVTFADLDGGEIDWYLRSGEWEGKAGAYAIQGAGAVFVERVEGDPTTVVGLPLRLTRSFLSDAGIVPTAG